MEVVKSVERVMRENDLQHAETLVLQIGEISSVIPEYMKKVYPVAVEGTCLEGAELEVEEIPAQARCQDCDTVFHATVTGGKCPVCGSRNMKLISGREFMIKELRCAQEDGAAREAGT